MKTFPKKEMDELIHGIREWRADEGNASVHKPMTAAHKIGKETGVAAIKWLNLIDAICSGVAVDAEDETIYEVLRLLGWVPDKGAKKGLGNTFACTGEKCPMKLADQIGGQVTRCTAHHCEHRTVPGTETGGHRYEP